MSSRNSSSRSGLKSPQSTTDPDFWIQARRAATALCLSYRIDTYGGVIIDSSELPETVDDFRTALRCSLDHLDSEGFQKAFWIRIPTISIEFVTVCLRDFDFYVHHAKKEYVMMVKWAHPTKPNPIPPPSTHQVGVGCVIDRGDGYILLVKERTGPAAVGCGIWKLPTGLVDPLEEICTAALREAKEETGLDCLFGSVICFRHSHGGSPALGASSDLFFACLLHPKTPDQEVVLQESEVQNFMWVHHTELHKITECTEGTSAWEIMERARSLISGDEGSPCVIKATKLPAWRRTYCDQYIFSPTLYIG